MQTLRIRCDTIMRVFLFLFIAVDNRICADEQPLTNHSSRYKTVYERTDWIYTLKDKLFKNVTTLKLTVLLIWLL